MLDYGSAAIPPERAREWLRSEVRIGLLDDGRFRIAPATREPTSTAGLVVEADLVTAAIPEMLLAGEDDDDRRQR
jgi:hypothetical protein